MKLLNESASSEVLTDNFGRSFPYLRLSITDVCNFRCGYCLPNGYQCNGKLSFLRIDEIQRLVTAFAELGTYKIRITGGEPTIRKDFTEIARIVSQHSGIKKTAFTTNGYRLRDHAQEWRDAGLRTINVSVDSLDANRFYKMTGHNRLDEVLQGVNAALEAGFENVKVNIVLHKGLNDHELPGFLAWAKHTPVSIRFIELMQTGENLDYFKKYHISAETITDQLRQDGWLRVAKSPEAGPAVEYIHPNYCCSVGIIAPYAKDFCKGCNRLRVTATGDLRLCLFGSQGTSLRHLLQEDEQKPLLKELISQQLAYKKSSHFLAFGDTGITPHLASVGG